MDLLPALKPALRSFAFALLLAAPSSAATPPVPEGWFIWPVLEPARGSALDVSALNPVRAGAGGRIVTRDGFFTTTAGERVRFWGTNLQSDEAFLSGREATALARRLARGGINIVRLHHLDNPWGVDSGGSIWPRGREDHLEIDRAQLDRLHRLIAAMREHGIYTNLNLKCSKTLVPADGFAPTVSQLPDFQKRVDLFDRRMIELQKRYARQVLTAVNPYTGLNLIDDPAVAVVEINNENSILGYFTRDLGRGLERLPEPFHADLRGRWNAWLAHRYADDVALAAAWNPPPGGADQNPLVRPDARWMLRVQPGTAAILAPGAQAPGLEVRVEQTSGIAWHAQVSLPGLPLEEGAVYTVSLEARADAPRRLEVGVGIDGQARPDEEWRSFGLLDTVDIGRDWTPVRLVFPAHSVAGAPAALSLNVAQQTGTVEVRAVQIAEGSEGGGLQPGQSARAGTIPLPLFPTRAQWADWIHFLADTDRAFADEMRGFLRDDLGVRAPLVCSQFGFGGTTALWREADSDFVDTHVYWQHPDFPGGGFDRVRWTIRNSPQLAVFSPRSFGELGNLAMHRVAGKPFAVSEYDHPWPGDFVCEMYPSLAAFACRQDWDAVYTYTSGPVGARNPERAIRDFFDQLNHPAKWNQSPWGALVFRRGLIAPASASAELQLASPPWAEQPHADLLWRKLTDGPLNFQDVRLSTTSEKRSGAARLARSGESVNSPMRVERTARGPVLVVSAEKAVAAVGFLGGARVQAGVLSVACERFGRDFASVTAVALDNRALRESQRILLTVVARAENQRMGWNENRTTVGAGWGDGPPIAERVPATIVLDVTAGRVVHALAPDGRRTRRISTAATGRGVSFSISPADRTLHYEIVAR